MASPFSLFRKNQKTLTVALTGLAMFAFVILGSGDPNAEGSGMAFALMVICGVAAIAWAFGYRSGKGTEYASWGAITAAVAAGAFWFFSAPAPVVTTTAGNISREEFAQLRNRRIVTNQFLQTLYSAAVPFPEIPEEFRGFLGQFPPEQRIQILQQFSPQTVMAQRQWEMGQQNYRFDYGRSRDERGAFAMSGDRFNRDVIFGYILGKEADRLGISVSDNAISEFTKPLREQVTKKTYLSILDRIGVSEDELFDLLRDELRNRQAFNLLYPATYTTPDEYWDLYKRLTVKQKVDATAIPVSAFVDAVGEPTEADLAQLFTQFRERVPNLENPGDPGFLQPPKVRLGYVRISFDKVREAIEKNEPPTEKEMEDFYEARKKANDPKFIQKAVPTDDESTTSEDGDESGSDGEKASDDDSKSGGEKKPSEGDAPTTDPQGGAKESDDTPKPKDDEAKTEEPAAPKEDVEPTDEGTDESEPPSPESDEDQSSRSEEADATLLSVSDDTAADDPAVPKADDAADDPEPKATEPEDTKSEDAASDGGEKPATEDDEPTAAKDDAEGEGDKPADGEKESDDGTDPEPEPVTYKSPEEMREYIRNTILDERATARVDELADEAYAKMRELGRDYSKTTLDQPDALGPSDLTSQMNEFAKEFGLVYRQTNLLSFEELRDSGEDEIGTASPDDWDGDERNGRPLVVTRFFAGGVTEFLHSPVLASSSRDEFKYVTWKLAGVPQHGPLLEAKDLTPNAKLDDIAEELGFEEVDRPTLFPRRGDLKTIGEYFAAAHPGDVEEDDAIDLAQFRVVATSVSGGKATGFQLYEPGIRGEVTEAWKLLNARKEAEKRAEELAEMAREQPAVPLKKLFEGQTVSGEEDGQELGVRRTLEFSWYTQSSVPTQDMSPPRKGPPRLTTIEQLPGAGARFMNFVFDELSEKEVGVVPNEDVSSYFVVKVLERSPAKPVQNKIQLAEFMEAIRTEGNPSVGGTYVMLASPEQSAVATAWVRRLEENQYEVKVNTDLR